MSVWIRNILISRPELTIERESGGRALLSRDLALGTTTWRVIQVSSLFCSLPSYKVFKKKIQSRVLNKKKFQLEQENRNFGQSSSVFMTNPDLNF